MGVWLVYFIDFQQNKYLKKLVKWHIFRNFKGENQTVTLKDEAT